MTHDELTKALIYTLLISPVDDLRWLAIQVIHRSLEDVVRAGARPIGMIIDLVEHAERYKLTRELAETVIALYEQSPRVSRLQVALINTAGPVLSAVVVRGSTLRVGEVTVAVDSTQRVRVAGERIRLEYTG